ncbi:uncharacterized protein LOC142923835 [Petromyzon marinus]|uniref:uncharacterized protein LOC142923835 n=1 Tax=Petromyzon marinus TaxID=7757 RepID=UPI003F70AF5F
MSKSAAKRKNPPVVQSDDEDSMEEDPATFPETGAPEMRPVEPSRPEQEEMAAVGGSSPPPDTWRVLSSQLELLLQSVAQLAITVAEVGARTRAPDTFSERYRWIPTMVPPASLEIGAIPSTDATRELGAIAVRDATLQPDAIFAVMPQPGAIANVTRHPGIATASPATPPCVSSSMLTSGGQRLCRLPPVRPFIAEGGDWMAF